MKGLLLKDILVLRKQFKVMVLIFVGYAFLGFAANNYNFLASFIPFIFMMMVLTSFSHDEVSKWTGLALSLPVTRSQLVLSKYLLLLFLSAVGMLVSNVYGYLMLLIMKQPITSELLAVSLACTLACILFISILMPAIFRFGVEKSRYLMFIVFFAPFIAVVLIEKTGLADKITLPQTLTQMSDAQFWKYLTLGGIGLVAVVMAVSILVSNQIVKKQEY